MTGADAIEAAMVVMALALIGYAVVSLIEARRRKGEGSTPLTTETQTQVAARLNISVSVLVRCPAMHNFRSLRQMMVQRRRRNHASSLRLTGHHAAWRAGFIHASLQTVAS